MLHFCLHAVNDIFIHCLYGDVIHVGDAHHTVHSRSQGHKDHVILVLAAGRLPFGAQYAHHLEGCFVDADGLADGIPVRKQVIHNGLANDTDPVLACHVMVVNVSAFLNRIVTDINNVRGRALNVGRPVLIAHYQLVTAGNHRRYIFDSVNILLNRFGVVIGQTRPTAGLDAGPGSRAAPGLDDEQVTAQTGNIIFDLFLDSKAQADHGNHGPHADDDTQQCQQRAQLVGYHAVNGHLDRLIEHNRVPAFRHCSGDRPALPGCVWSAARYPAHG